MVRWFMGPLSGLTEIVMTPGADIPIGPVINAGEVFQMLPLDERTLTRDDSHSLHFFYSYTLIRIVLFLN